MTQGEFQASVKLWLAQRTGEKIATCLASTRAIQQFYGWYASQKSNSPGRHYSFIAVKK
jgi:hypothetical protein